MEKIKLIHNDYRKFMETNASKLWDKNINYGVDQYIKDSENVDVLPFNLEKFNLPEDIEKIINSNFTEDYTDGTEYVLKGFTEGSDEWYSLTDKLNLKREMGYYYSGYCHNEQYNFYLSYCEGDIYLKLFTSKEEYKKSLEKTIKWYDEN